MIHALVGFVRTNPVLTAFQVASRVFLVWGIAVPVTEVSGYTLVIVTTYKLFKKDIAEVL